MLNWRRDFRPSIYIDCFSSSRKKLYKNNFKTFVSLFAVSVSRNSVGLTGHLLIFKMNVTQLNIPNRWFVFRPNIFRRLCVNSFKFQIGHAKCWIFNISIRLKRQSICTVFWKTWAVNHNSDRYFNVQNASQQLSKQKKFSKNNSGTKLESREKTHYFGEM